MSQTDYAIENAPGAPVRADINAQLQAIATLNSGDGAPTEKFPYMFWADTAEGKLKQRDGPNTAWIVIGYLASQYLGLVYFPSGTLLPFFQQSAPPGWTKKTDHNDKALRVVSGAGGGSGGTHGLSAPPDHTHAGASHIHSINAHKHELPIGFQGQSIKICPLNIFGDGELRSMRGIDTGEGPVNVTAMLSNANIEGAAETNAGGTGSTGAQSAKFAPLYVDVIIGQKD